MDANMLIKRSVWVLGLLVPAVIALGCTGDDPIIPPTRNIPRVDLPTLSVNRADNTLELNWADSVSIPQDQECRVLIPLNFAGDPEILTASFYVSDDRGVIQSGGGSFDPKKSPTAELLIDLGKIPEGSYSYEFTFLSGPGGPEGLEVTKKNGTLVVR
jgi:hypothetical protein